MQERFSSIFKLFTREIVSVIIVHKYYIYDVCTNYEICRKLRA